ncbi:transposase [Micromonospora sp. KC207]
MTRRHDLTDVQWAVLEPLLPVGRVHIAAINEWL